MRRLYCAQSVGVGTPASASVKPADANASESGDGGGGSVGSATAKLCQGAGASPTGAAVYEGSSEGDIVYGTTVPSELLSGGGIVGVGGGERGRGRPVNLVRQSTVVELLLGMLCLAAFLGWKAQHFATAGSKANHPKVSDGVIVHATGTPPAHGVAVGGLATVAEADCEEGVVNGDGKAARRRVHLSPTKRARAA